VNNTCPTCGAIYNVASKDVGRKLKCKKCNSSLRVTDAGLEQDTDAPADEARPERDDRDEPRPKKKKSRADRESDSGGGINLQAILDWFPTVVFAFGVFLVVVCTAFPLIGQAATQRASANKDRLKNEMAREKFALQPKKPKSEWLESEKKKIEDETPKIEARYERLIEEATLDAEGTRISNARDVWFEQYGLMFGFILVAFGCIGYLRMNQQSDYSLVVKVVAGAILTLMMVAIFTKFAGCAGPR
jgi:predicted Zn finger-like uncharacterized protein